MSETSLRLYFTQVVEHSLSLMETVQAVYQTPIEHSELAVCLTAFDIPFSPSKLLNVLLIVCNV